MNTPTSKTEMRSIMHVADYAPTYSGNFVASLRLAAAECRARGFRIVWVFPKEVETYSWFRELAQESHSAAYVIARDASLWQLTRQIGHWAVKENVAIVHTHFSRFDIAAVLAKIISAITLQNFHLVWHVHSAFGEESRQLRGLKNFVKLRLLGSLCYAMPVAYPLAEALRDRGFAPERIHVVQNGIDVAHATASRHSRAEVRRRLQVSESTFTLLAFGWTPVRKGVDTMLRAMSRLAGGDRTYRLLLVGTKELTDYLAKWEDRSALGHVTVMAPEEFVGDLFAASDLFVSPSRAEGWPYSVAEAMANAVPVASSSIPAMSWAKNAPGILFSDPEDEAGLAENIRMMAELSPAERRAQGEQAKEFVCARHTVERWGQSVWEFYAQLLRWHEPPKRQRPTPAAAN